MLKKKALLSLLGRQQAISLKNNEMSTAIEVEFKFLVFYSLKLLLP
jgi:hypothetical protein